jgi:Flp pilus assembly protein protease CpaA
VPSVQILCHCSFAAVFIYLVLADFNGLRLRNWFKVGSAAAFLASSPANVLNIKMHIYKHGKSACSVLSMGYKYKPGFIMSRDQFGSVGLEINEINT